jgi:RNA polymerase sigma-70 factor (ECF subfamily)
MADADEDFALLDRWCVGDRDAGNALFKRHFESLYQFLAHKVDGELDDLVQDTFVACMHGRATFRRQCAFRTYLLAIAKNTLYAHWRRRAASRPQIDFDEISIASLSTSIGGRLAHQEDRESLLLALRQLPLEQQILLEMYYWQELDREQLSIVFDVDPKTIGSRLFRARQALRDQLHNGPERRAGEIGDDLDDWARSLRPESPTDASGPPDILNEPGRPKPVTGT